MQNKEKVALFDFCETLANFQTADAFVKFVREATNNKTMWKKERFRLFLRRLKLIDIFGIFFKHSSPNKRIVLWQLRGFNRTELDNYAKEYYYKRIKPNFIKPLVDKLTSLQQDNWRIVIVSGGYYIYLKYFCEDYGISLDDLIAVRIKFKGDRCAGTFDGGDRLWDKTEILDRKFDKHSIESVAFSDSISDLPFLKWADEGYVIRRSDKKQWAINYNLKEILWYEK